MKTREMIRAWVQIPLGGTHAERLAAAKAFRDEVGGRGSVTIHRNLDDELGMVVDVSPTAHDPLILTGSDEIKRLGLIVSEACDHVMTAMPAALLTWEAID